MNITFFTGLYDKSAWTKVWKNKNLKNRLTNVSTSYQTALEFSWDKDFSVVEISNVPIEAITGFRKESYSDDEDYTILNNNKERQQALNIYDMFLLNLFPYKTTIKTKLR
jgi:hypothetical protein